MSDKKKRRLHARQEREAMAAIMEALNAWDPYRLIAGGAPRDEFEPEAANIYSALAAGGVDSEQELARLIAAVFEKWFGETFTAEECAAAARVIYAWWPERGGQGESA